jgi:hypothetical protein
MTRRRAEIKRPENLQRNWASRGSASPGYSDSWTAERSARASAAGVRGTQRRPARSLTARCLTGIGLRSEVGQIRVAPAKRKLAVLTTTPGKRGRSMSPVSAVSEPTERSETMRAVCEAVREAEWSGRKAGESGAVFGSCRWVCGEEPGLRIAGPLTHTHRHGGTSLLLPCPWA